jgi:hypothetical protein
VWLQLCKLYDAFRKMCFRLNIECRKAPSSNPRWQLSDIAGKPRALVNIGYYSSECERLEEEEAAVRRRWKMCGVGGGALKHVGTPYDELEVRRRLSEAPPPAPPSVSPVPAHHRSLPTSPSGKRSPDRFIPPPAETLPPPSPPFEGRLPKICCRNSSSSLEILRGRGREGRSGGGKGGDQGGDQGEDTGNRGNR